jgi:adapter protein MecA 1/2
MRIAKINDNTVRIYISFAELQDMNLSLVDFFQRSARTDQFFWDLLTKAREEVDFYILDQSFWIQAMVLSEEEFVVTVIKQDDMDPDLSVLSQLARSQHHALTKSENNEWLYAFADLEDVIAAVARLPLMEADSVLYFYEEEYYLALSKIMQSRKRKNIAALLAEYGEAVDFKEAFLKEHGEVIIAEEALKRLTLLQSTKSNDARR